jgi:hypothetical protein
MLEAMTVNQLQTLPEPLLDQVKKTEAFFLPGIDTVR